MTQPDNTQTSFLAQCGGFTPSPDILVNEYGSTTAHIWGVIWRYCQGERGICDASNQTIADRAGVSHRCVWTHIKKLIDDGFIEDFDPDVRNRPHRLCTKKGEEKIKGMQNLHTKQAEGMQELPSRYAKNAELGMQNLQEKIVVVLDDDINNAPAQEKEITWEKVYNRWVAQFGDMKSGQAQLFGDYFDDNPEWTFQAANETIARGELDDPFPYFKRIIDGWFKLGHIPEREPAEAPQNGANNGHKSISGKTAAASVELGDKLDKAFKRKAAQ